MATLTIKPTAAGNDVQIKSGDGNTTHATFGDTSTVNMSAGSIASAVTGTLGSGIVFPAGHVIQVKHTISNTTFSSNVGQTITNITFLNTEITPKKQSSRMVITFNFGTISSTAATSTAYGKVRYIPTGGTEVDVLPIGQKLCEGGYQHVGVNAVSSSYQGDVGTSCVVSHLPDTTIPLTYKFYAWTESVGGGIYLNQTQRDGVDDFETVSSCTIMEVAV